MNKKIKSILKYSVGSGLFFSAFMFFFDLLDQQVHTYRIESYLIFFLCMAASGAVGKWFQLKNQQQHKAS